MHQDIGNDNQRFLDAIPSAATPQVDDAARISIGILVKTHAPQTTT